MSPLLVSVAAFVGVTALIGAVFLLFRERDDSRMENRLDLFASGTPTAPRDMAARESVLSAPLDAAPSILEAMLPKIGNLTLLLEQADTTLTPSKFVAISAGLGLAGAVVGVLVRLPVALAPFLGLSMCFLPLMWVFWRKRSKLKKIAAQLPEALELMARALRAGHSLQAGFNLVQQEMQAPISVEFGRVFEEQNLGITLDEAMGGMVERVPNLDLKFFCTAVVLQRQTGGDLAEILDKIGRLIRERFQIWGQIQALTGEGRLSGIVLLALPPVLFLAVYRLNPDYVMMLFRDPMGKQMLMAAIGSQVLGALWIRKIVNIKV